MATLELIIGLGITSFLLLYFIFHLDEEHVLLRLLTIFFFLSILLLIPKALGDDSDFCEIVVSNTTDLNAINSTSYKYERFCSDNPKTTTSIFHKIIIWFIRIFSFYVLVYLIYRIMMWLGAFDRMFQKLKNKGIMKK
jgi:hypothetical protein|tara:strand:- start:28 stop:441 length:414 start_codon:yes stop_codon:yes gene_type:complete